MGNRPTRVAEATKEYVHKAINSSEEQKNVSTAANIAAGAAASNFTGSIINLQPIIQGVNINERVGNVIRVNRIKIRAWYSAAVANCPTIVRYIVFRSKQQPSTTPPTTASVLATVGTFAATTSMYGTGAESNRAYDILVDKSHVLQVPNGGSQIHLFNINLRKKVSERLVHFTGAAATDYGKGALFLLVISNQDTATSPSFQYGLQTWYKDG